MRNISKNIFMLFAAVVGFSSCEKAYMGSSEEIELIPEAGYIRFSTDVATKAPIILNLRGESFGVLGYNYGYSTKWDVARVLAKPELFYDLPVECDNNGVCSYDIDATKDDNQLAPWSLSQKYSFFAYYPIKSTSNEISISGNDAVNMPTVTYPLPFGNGEVDPDQLVDLMTAYAIDKTAGDGVVGFTFQHRLFCIEVLAQNYNTKNSIKLSDGTTVEIDADEFISDLTLTIDNIAYKEITVPMMKGDDGIKTVKNDKGSVVFRLLDQGSTVKVPSHDEKLGAVSLSGTDGSKTVMLIPQDASGTAFKGKLSFNLTNKNGDTEIIERTFEPKMNFREGVKYTITINFTGETIVVAFGEAGAWEPYSVNFDFE